MADDTDQVDQFTCIALQSFTISITLLGFIIHLGLGVFYYFATGTFPVKERILNRIEQLRESRQSRLDHHHHPLTAENHQQQAPLAAADN